MWGAYPIPVLSKLKNLHTKIIFPFNYKFLYTFFTLFSLLILEWEFVAKTRIEIESRVWIHMKNDRNYMVVRPVVAYSASSLSAR